MSTNLAPYACDNCRQRKVACSRQRRGCQRCKSEGSSCIYSRFGITRRNRKRKHPKSVDDASSTTLAHSPHAPRPAEDGLQPHLATDIAATRDRLAQGPKLQQSYPLRALSSLSTACAAVWHEGGFEDAQNGFFLFPDCTEYWANIFTTAVKQGHSMFQSPPAVVLEQLRAGHPHQIQDRAWLVMYYSMILSHVSSSDASNEFIKKKLRCNLWLSLNDARLFLEPSDANIQALTLLACHVEEFTTPALCWMLSTTACRMLQALGMSHRRLDEESGSRRVMMFWHLNLLDKGLAIIFGRPPSFHSGMMKGVGLPSLQELLSKKGSDAAQGSGLFGAHYLHQKLQLAQIMADIWECLYAGPSPEEAGVLSNMEALKTWYGEARKILDAAALAEKACLDRKGARSIEIGLASLHFIYLYLLVLLTRTIKATRNECLDLSKQIMWNLDSLVCDFDEPYIGMIWQILCSPFTPFLELFGEIITKKNVDDEESKKHMAALQRLPMYLSKMSLRSSFAARLERIATVFVDHANSVMQSRENGSEILTQIPSLPTKALPVGQTVPSSTLQWDAFFDQDAPNSDLDSWTSGFFDEAVLDWLEWKG